MIPKKEKHFPLKSILWIIIKKQLLGSVMTVAITTIMMVLLAIFLQPFEQITNLITEIFGITLLSDSFFWLVIIFFIIGVIASIISSLWLGFPFGRYIRESLFSIIDASQAFARGRLHHRIKFNENNEFQEVAIQFNQMADRIEAQVSSLQKLINQNNELVKQMEVAASLEERRKLARNLHDAVSQQLFAISMSISTLPKLIQKKQETYQGEIPSALAALQEDTKLYIAQIEDMVIRAQQELRALIMHLRPVSLEGASFNEALQTLLQELKEKYPEVSFEWKLEELVSLEQGMEDHLFHIVQEALSNMLRHAKATQFSIQVSQDNERILLKMWDDGIGFDIQTKKKKSSYGIGMMMERTEELGGKFDLYSFPGKGTRIEIRIPISKGEDQIYEQQD